jgi:hypothetical protein
VSPFWRVAPFIDHPGNFGLSRYEFEWEREWRVPGGLTFAEHEVAFLFLPEEWHAAVRTPFVCIDPRWSAERLQAGFNQIQPLGR